jgi:molybdopterin-synthase adenylyltransferase
MDDQALLRYSRHILLPQIGIEGQEQLETATVLIVGAGGLGCPVALYLGAAGVGNLIICDSDQVDLTNLQRQIGHRTDSIGLNKAVSLRNAVLAVNPRVEIHSVEHRLEGKVLQDAIARADVVIDCSDNFATRHAVNRASVSLKKPLVSGAAIGFSGQVAVFDARHADSPCYQCLFPETHEEGPRCSEAGVLSPLVGVVGSLQAVEVIKLATGAGQAAIGQLTLIDALNTTFRQIRVPRDPACQVCGSGQGHNP